MKRFAPIAALLLVSLVPARSWADGPEAPVSERPSSGVGLLVTGGIFMGIGALNLATSPLCTTSLIRSDLRDTCLGLSIGIGAGFVLASIPMLVMGANARAHYNEWRRAHPFVSGMSFAPSGTGFAAGWSVSF